MRTYFSPLYTNDTHHPEALPIATQTRLLLPHWTAPLYPKNTHQIWVNITKIPHLTPPHHQANSLDEVLNILARHRTLNPSVENLFVVSDTPLPLHHPGLAHTQCVVHRTTTKTIEYDQKRNTKWSGPYTPPPPQAPLLGLPSPQNTGHRIKNILENIAIIQSYPKNPTQYTLKTISNTTTTPVAYDILQSYHAQSLLPECERLICDNRLTPHQDLLILAPHNADIAPDYVLEPFGTMLYNRGVLNRPIWMLIGRILYCVSNSTHQNHPNEILVKRYDPLQCRLTPLKTLAQRAPLYQQQTPQTYHGSQ